MTNDVRRMFESNADKMRKRCEKEGHYGIRSGYYDGDVKSGEAVRAMRRQLCEAVDVTAGDHVLDVGCGFGDCLLWLAEHHDVTGVGVDIATPQVETAEKLAERRNLTDAVEFRRVDYHDLSDFEEDSFDVVWALESLMHTDESASVLADFAKLLGPGGRVVVCDPFKTGTLSQSGQPLLSDLEDGNEAHIDDLDEFASALRANGFRNVERRNITDSVVPGISKRAKFARWLLRPIARAGNLVGMVDKKTVDALSAAAASGKLFRSRLLSYNIVTAQYTGE